MNKPFFPRWYGSPLVSAVKKPFVHIIFGARQTGKTSLLRHLFPDAALWYNLADPEERNRLILDPGAFSRECRALPQNSSTPAMVIVDEAQTVPALFDAVQALYDNDPMRWRFVLCGSSARKLRATGANLLPGRSILHRIYPLALCERPAPSDRAPSLILPFSLDANAGEPLFPPADIEERLAYGDLPGIALLPEENRAPVLKSYATVHLEEEIRREAIIRDWNAFVNFLHLAAIHSGEMVNMSALSRETGVSLTAIKSHYQLIEDLFVGFTVPAFSGSARKSVLSTPRFFFFDLGIRHAAAGLNPGRELVNVSPGQWFEQWVGIELWKRLQYLGNGKLFYLRTKSGMEIDFIIMIDGKTIPIEVKWTDRPSPKDARHVLSFIKETPSASHGFIVCRCPRPQQLSENITAIPWWMI
jgi:uncharacterized protein